MKRTTLSAAAAAFVVLAGCATAPTAEPSGPTLSSAEADVRGPDGRAVARATANQAGDAVRVRVEAAGLAPGTYAVHVHEFGRCDPPAFDSAGAHWNPLGRQHGMQNPQGPHMGDLPNLMVGATGQGSFEFSIPAARMSGGSAAMLDSDGAALVVHANPDDHRTDPSGNSGARIACGVFR